MGILSKEQLSLKGKAASYILGYLPSLGSVRIWQNKSLYRGAHSVKFNPVNTKPALQFCNRLQ